MDIWMVKIGEPLPVGPPTREQWHRTGTAARILAAAGHRVTWFTSTFNRVERSNAFDRDTELNPFPGMKVRLIHSPGYRRSISWARLRDQRIVARRFAGMVRAEPPPDLILCAYPTAELARECTAYGKAHGVPVVLDMRDMWPDIIVSSAPAPLRFLFRLMLLPMARKARAACAQATAITGITEPFVDWGLRRGGRDRTVLDRAFPLAHGAVELPAALLEQAGRFWDAAGIREGDPRFTVAFFGTLGHQFELATILQAGGDPRLERAGIRIVICGKGDNLLRYQEMAGRRPGILFPGWVDPAQMSVLMRRSHAGLDPLPDRADFLATINNKAAEYLSAGLPIISSPRKGVLFELLRQEACGMSYAPGDGDGLAELLLTLAGDAGLRQSLSANARRLFTSRFRAEAVYADMGNYLEEVIRAYGARRERRSGAEP